MNSIKYILCVLLLFHSYTSAQTLGTIANKPGNIGREFYFTFLPNWFTGGSTSIYIMVSSPVTTRVRVETETGGVIKDVTVEGNKPTRIEIPSGIALCYSKVYTDDSPADNVYPGAAVHITSEYPVSVYAVNSGGYSGESYLVLPVETLGTEYIIATVPDPSVGSGGYKIPGVAAIVATESNTRVQITLGGTSNVVTAGGMKFGDTKIITLNKGDIYVISTDCKQSEEDFSGTKISASKSVAVISGHYCGYIPATTWYANHMVEMQIPTYAWGYTNLVPRYSPKKNSFMLKVFAKDAMTNISNNGTYIKTLTKSGGAEGSAYMYRRSDANGNNVSVYSGNKPIGCTVYCPGQQEDNTGLDPFQMTVIPLEQFAKTVFFSTQFPADLKADEYFGVVFPLAFSGTIPEDLEFGTIKANNQIQWQKFTTMFGSSVGGADKFLSGSEVYGYKECKSPGAGVYAIRCSKPIGVYGYAVKNGKIHSAPLTTLMLDLSKQSDTIKPEFKYARTDSSTSGTATDLPKDDAVRSNLSKVFLNYGSYNVRFTAPSITNATTTTLSWQMDVVDTQIPALAIITATDRAGNDSTITITYTPKQIIVKPKVTHTALTVCQNDTVTFSCNDGFRKYEWSTGDTTKGIKVQCTYAGTYPYWVTVTNDSGLVQTSDTFTVVVNALPKKPKITQHGDTLTTELLTGVEYKWYKDGIELTAAKSNVLVITQTGVYMVRAIYQQSACLSQSEQFYGKVTQTDVQESTHTQTFQLIPNPANNIAYVQYNVSTDATLEIVNTLGMVIMKFSLPKELTNIAVNLQALPQDIYRVRMLSNNQTTVTTLVVQR